MGVGIINLLWVFDSVIFLWQKKVHSGSLGGPIITKFAVCNQDRMRREMIIFSGTWGQRSWSPQGQVLKACDQPTGSRSNTGNTKSHWIGGILYDDELIRFSGHGVKRSRSYGVNYENVVSTIFFRGRVCYLIFTKIAVCNRDNE